MFDPPIPVPSVTDGGVTAGSPTWVLGILVGTIVVLATVVIPYLFKLFVKRTNAHEKQRAELVAAHTKERETWLEEKAVWDAEREAERETDRALYEQKHREVVVHYDTLFREDHLRYEQREDAIRKEHAVAMERFYREQAEHMERSAQAEQRRSASELALLEKMHNRLSGGRRRGGGGEHP